MQGLPENEKPATDARETNATNVKTLSSSPRFQLTTGYYEGDKDRLTGNHRANAAMAESLPDYSTMRQAMAKREAALTKIF